MAQHRSLPLLDTREVEIRPVVEAIILAPVRRNLRQVKHGY